MSIASVAQRGSMVVWFDVKGRLLGSAPAGFGPEDGLVGYTDETVSIRRGLMIFVYDARGRQVGAHRAA